MWDEKNHFTKPYIINFHLLVDLGERKICNMTKISLIRKLTCMLALAVVLVTSFVSPSYAAAAPSGCVAVTTNNSNQYTLINAAESQGGTKYRQGNKWSPGIKLSTLGVIPEFDNDYFMWNAGVREWWRSNRLAIGSKNKYFYKSNQRENPNSNNYLWFDGDEIQWQKADGQNCT